MLSEVETSDTPGVMDPQLRSRFNADFNDQRYAELLRMANPTARIFATERLACIDNPLAFLVLS